METKSKPKIAIIGGGISGLATLHYLRQNHGDAIDVCLFEKNAKVGGTVESCKTENGIFEIGPNGFLDSKPRTLAFIDELGLTDSILQADSTAKIRYIADNNTLHRLPTKPQEFLSFKLLSLGEKWRVLGDFFIKAGLNPNESLYEFGARRFGERFTEIFLDAMVNGIYGGSIKTLVLREAFPRIYELEQHFGSLFRAQIALKRKSKNATGSPTGRLTSFDQGMSQLINTVSQKYKNHIQTQKAIRKIEQVEGNYQLTFEDGKQETFNAVFLSTPSYAAAHLTQHLDAELSKALHSIEYAPIWVVGLAYKDVQLPNGFGYLIPSGQKNLVLGALFESNIFPQRFDDSAQFVRVMLGGVHNPNIRAMSKEEVIKQAREELNNTLGLNVEPVEVMGCHFDNAIPQYNKTYLQAKENITAVLNKHPNLHIVSNYWKGIAFNDCIENAFKAAKDFTLPTIESPVATH